MHASMTVSVVAFCLAGNFIITLQRARCGMTRDGHARDHGVKMAARKEFRWLTPSACWARVTSNASTYNCCKPASLQHVSPVRMRPLMPPACPVGEDFCEIFYIVQCSRECKLCLPSANDRIYSENLCPKLLNGSLHWPPACTIAGSAKLNIDVLRGSKSRMNSAQ
jgi:hypothetical protein